MECKYHPGFDLPNLTIEGGVCDSCGQAKPSKLVGYGPCRMCGREYNLKGLTAEEQAAADVAEPPAGDPSAEPRPTG